MIKKFLLASAMVLSYNSVNAAEVELKCYPNKEFMTLIDEHDLLTLYQGKLPNKMTQEIMISKDRFIYTIEYNRPDNTSATSIDKYCVTTKLDGVTFNDVAIELLNKVLERVKGKPA